MTHFLHLTDLHLSVGANHQAKADLLARIADAIPGLRIPPDFVVISGDLADRGDPDSYAALRPMVDAFPVPVVLALGNHDRRAGFHATFSATAHDGPHDHDTVLAGLHVITLDTAVPGRVSGALDAGQIDWLKGAMARHAELPKLIVAHHPPMTEPGALPWTCLDAASSDALAEALAGHRVTGILSGHIHMNRFSLWRGVPLVVSSGLHSTIDPLYDAGLRIREGASFAMVRLIGTDLSVHFVPVLPEGRELGLIDIARLKAFA